MIHGSWAGPLLQTLDGSCSRSLLMPPPPFFGGLLPRSVPLSLAASPLGSRRLRRGERRPVADPGGGRRPVLCVPVGGHDVTGADVNLQLGPAAGRRPGELPLQTRQGPVPTAAVLGEVPARLEVPHRPGTLRQRQLA